jgi:hypothetical protein
MICRVDKYLTWYAIEKPLHPLSECITVYDINIEIAMRMGIASHYATTHHYPHYSIVISDPIYGLINGYVMIMLHV